MRFLIAALAVVSVSCNSKPARRNVASEPPGDNYLWLEDIEGTAALDFVKQENDLTLSQLKASPDFRGIESDIRKIVLASDRLPNVALQNGKLYNFWQDANHVRGLWRRTSVEHYKKKNPRWETVLDLDALSAAEKENWVWKGADCLEPENKRCLLSLSRGGKDAAVIREFDVETKSFVRDGFQIPEGKTTVSWAGADALYVGTDDGPGSLSDSGYAIVSKLWTRGTPFSEAKEVSRGETTDVSAGTALMRTPEGTLLVHSRNISFFETEHWIELDGRRAKIPMPSDANLAAMFRGHLLFSLTKDLTTKTRTLRAGSLVALPIARITDGPNAQNALELVFEPTKKIVLTSVSRTKNAILLDILDNVRGRLVKVTRRAGGWISEPLPLGGNGVASVSSANAWSDDILATYTDFLTPTSVAIANTRRAGRGFTTLKSAPARFDASHLVTEQFEAISADGTRIPYFIVHRQDIALNGKNPTLLYGYGGFEISMTPTYLSTVGKVWCERGGVYVLANIRGGGEFGPTWHEAARKEHHQRAFDDFIAVAEDLIARKVTSPAHLGIQGGSNGGLLTGAVFVQRPDLFNAALVEVPLLDMLRFNKLLAGASWMGEYGNPDIPAEREYILKYSPYQNVKPKGKYPDVFFLTSTKDDRVHPGHARKMVARMREYGHPLYYFENTEGGHGGSANLEQKILWSSLEMTYLWKQLR